MSLFETYEPQPERCGAVWLTAESLSEVADELLHLGYDVAIHKTRDSGSWLSIDDSGRSLTARVSQYLMVSAYSLEVMDYDDFRKNWRKERT
jgi:hypothetical protein